jgi:hypothetical protein
VKIVKPVVVTPAPAPAPAPAAAAPTAPAAPKKPKKVAAPLVQPVVKPVVVKPAAAAPATKLPELEFTETVEIDDTVFIHNKRGDMIDENCVFVGHWDGTTLDRSAEKPGDIDAYLV